MKFKVGDIIISKRLIGSLFIIKDIIDGYYMVNFYEKSESDSKYYIGKRSDWDHDFESLDEYYMLHKMAMKQKSFKNELEKILNEN